MKKLISTNLKTYTFNAERKGAKYTFDDEHWMNGGEFAEAQLKNALGLDAKKDANTPFDAGSDIEELEMSVKSSKATLTSVILGKDLATSLDTYFERVASTKWAWVVVADETITAYIMDKKEFREFTENWATFQVDRMAVRFKATSGKMITWLEEKVEN